MLSQTKIKTVLQLRERGYSYSEIIIETGISYTSVASYCSRYRPHLKNVAIKNKYSERLDEITFLRRKGTTTKDIARKTGLSINTIKRVCRLYCPGLKNITQRKISFRQEREIIQYYRYRYPIVQISNMVKVSKNTVRRILKKQGFNPELMYRDR